MDATSVPYPTSATALELDELIDSLVASHRSFVDDLPYVGASGCLAATRALVKEEVGVLDARLSGEEDRLHLQRLEAWLEQEMVRLEPWFDERGEPRPSWIVGRQVLPLCDRQRLIMTSALDLEPADPMANRCLDPGFDLVSLLVGLYVRDETRLAHYALDRYLRRSGDYSLMRLISVFAVCRCLAGARRALQRSESGREPAFRMAEIMTECRRYLDLAEQVSNFRFPPLIIGVGVSGSGKSRFMAEIVERLGAVRLCSDAERRRLFGIDPQAVEPDTAVDIFSPESTERTYQRLASLAGLLLNAGIPTCIDATCLTQAQRQLLRQQGEARGLPVLIVSFEADEDTLKERIIKRSGEYGVEPDASLAVLNGQMEGFEDFSPDERRNLLRIDTTAEHVGDTLALLVEKRFNLSFS
ncbi:MULTISPECIES: AAA family ATPase [Halomonadaceae]|jgi:predicted kinase|uniref:AAA family ATPase n=1 Tax=Billgrantia aerodenitrificans TaxID=2733483 RepID=A0ABS9AQ97_9GAMM|nr:MULTISPECIES: bifunctional aminoglycoside phosphotransferase/ATP-binding protein [Halomonas]MCE8024026.1 AAA family ATPase [Halomonas aerodenitrificans]MCE8036284.1 AAA family ATPase [Halomonas sp. MCCC 1A11062]